MEYDETARLKKRYKNEGLLGDAEFSGLKSLLQTKIAPESAGARSLLDVLQSASNMSAENISAPVEGIAWLLEKAGMPIKDPVLGQKWMADRGLTRHVKEGAQKVIGDAAGMLLPFAGTKAGAQAIAKGLLDIGENGLPVGLSIKDVSEGLLPSPKSLTMPSVPTGEQMKSLSRLEDVPLSNAVSFQSARKWDKFKKGEHPGALIEGYGNAPVALKLETGEYVIYDGNHRTDLALKAGEKQMPMHVIDVKAYDPAHAGRAPAKPSMSDDELLASLLGP